MSYTILITAEARQDELEAYIYYESLLTGLGEDFLHVLEEHYATIAQNPFLYSYTDSRNILRDVKTTRFPYVIIFEVIGNLVVIYTIHNTYKKPAL